MAALSKSTKRARVKTVRKAAVAAAIVAVAVVAVAIAAAAEAVAAVAVAVIVAVAAVAVDTAIAVIAAAIDRQPSRIQGRASLGAPFPFSPGCGTGPGYKDARMAPAIRSAWFSSREASRPSRRTRNFGSVPL